MAREEILDKQQMGMVAGMGADFTRWAALTDAYAAQLAAMAQGEPNARAEVVRLADKIRELRQQPNRA